METAWKLSAPIPDGEWDGVVINVPSFGTNLGLGDLIRWTAERAECGWCNTDLVPLEEHRCQRESSDLVVRVFRVPTRDELRAELYEWIDYLSVSRPR